MKLSRYLRNILESFPANHEYSVLAAEQFLEVVRAEWRRDNFHIASICEVWGLDPFNYVIYQDD